MSKKGLKRAELSKKILHKNRLVILNEDTFEEVFSLKLNLMNVFVILTLSSIFLIAITTYIIAFTPLREYIPGYSSSKLKEDTIHIAIKSDSIDHVLKQNSAYMESIKKVLTGEIEYTKFNKDSIVASGLPDVSRVDFSPSKEDSILRNTVALEDKYKLFEKAERKSNIIFFPPVNGFIKEKYNPKTKHFAVDIPVSANTAIKSIADGTVIFSEQTLTNGNTVIVKHTGDFISVYKHCASVTTLQGDKVRTGEVIALAGSIGEQSTGIHLYFELWKNGNLVDPANFIDFE